MKTGTFPPFLSANLRARLHSGICLVSFCSSSKICLNNLKAKSSTWAIEIDPARMITLGPLPLFQSFSRLKIPVLDNQII
jgi:hypothetical protein